MGIISYISDLYSGNSSSDNTSSGNSNGSNNIKDNNGYNIIKSSDNKSLAVSLDNKHYELSKVTNVIYKLSRRDDITDHYYYHIISYDRNYSTFLHDSHHNDIVNRYEETHVFKDKTGTELKLYINAKYEKTIPLSDNSNSDVEIYNVYHAGLAYIHKHRIDLILS